MLGKKTLTRRRPAETLESVEREFSSPILFKKKTADLVVLLHLSCNYYLTPPPPPSPPLPGWGYLAPFSQKIHKLSTEALQNMEFKPI